MICFIHRSMLNTDPRMQKYVRACEVTNTPYFIISWNRTLLEKNAPHEHSFKKYAPFGEGKSIIWNLIYIAYIYWLLLSNWKKYKVIHAANFHIFVFIYPFGLFGKKLIYDMYDKGPFPKIERWLCKHSDLFIIPSRYRLEQIELEISDFKRFLEIENVPIFSQLELAPKTKSKYLRLSYVGSFERQIRGIENTLQVVEKNSRLTLDIAGSGGGLEELVQEFSQRCDRINYHGKVEYNQALQIMGSSDFIMGLYYVEHNPAHKYAAPNKYYESLFLNTPIITNQGTIISKKVAEYNTGFVIGESYTDLDSFFNNLEENSFEEIYRKKVECCNALWNQNYNDYLQQKMIDGYLAVVKKL